MGIAGNKWGFTVGRLPHGPLDKNSEIPAINIGKSGDSKVVNGAIAKLSQYIG